MGRKKLLTDILCLHQCKNYRFRFSHFFLHSQTPGDSLKPTVEWGPALVKHRALVAKYIPGFVIDPWGKEIDPANTVSPNDVNLQVGCIDCMVAYFGTTSMYF